VGFSRKVTNRQNYKFVADTDTGELHLISLHAGGVVPEKLRQAARLDCLETAKDFVSAAAMRGEQLTVDESAAISLLKAEIHRLDGDRTSASMRARHFQEYGHYDPVDEKGQRSQYIDTVNGVYPDPSAPNNPKRKTYQSIFGSAASNTMDGFESTAEYFDLLRRGVPDSRFRMEAAAFSGTTGSGGAYVLPSAVSATLLNSLLARSVVLGRANVVPMRDRTTRVWGFDDEDQSSANSIMGINFQVVEEEAQRTPQAGRVRAIELKAKKLMAVTKVSVELLQDSARFEAELQAKFAEAAGFVLDDMLINGQGGNGEFLGILQTPSKITVAAGGQTTGTFTFDNVTSLRSRLMDGGEPIWIVNQDTLPQLYNMTLASAGLVMAFDGKELLGIPVEVSSKAQSLSTEGDVILCDLSRFLVGMRSEIAIESSPHFAFDTGEVAFRLIMRLDSADSMTAALTPRYSSSTLGWCVTLATRTT